MNGAATMWTPETVRIRFVEAAGTERFLSALRLPTANGYWPEFLYDEDDRSGWDQAAKDDHLAIWQGRGTAKADALSRYQECLTWTIERVTDPERRRLVWGFAFCRAYKREFGKWCDERGRAKSTAYNRLNRIWDHLSFNLNNDGVLLREPSPYWVGHESPRMACVRGRMAQNDNAPEPIKFSPGYQTEPSRDLIQSQDDAETFAKFLERRNARLRKLNAWRNEQVA
jgi:hypothetical protein